MSMVCKCLNSLMLLACFLRLASIELVVTRDFMGMFSNIDWVLDTIRFSEKDRSNIYVKWGSSCPYYQENGYQGSTNVWEYYFYPLPERQEELAGRDIVYSWENPRHLQDCFGIISHYDYRCLYYEIIRRYIHLKPHVEERINNMHAMHIKNKRVIGVHLRSNNKEGACIFPKNI